MVKNRSRKDVIERLKTMERGIDSIAKDAMVGRRRPRLKLVAVDVSAV